MWKIRDEPYAEEIAEKILQRNRKSKAGWTTTELHEVIASALVRIPEKERKEAVKKASARTFQALRIDVNHEFEALYALMEKLPFVLKPNGRVAILTFHSGEDRLGEKDLPAVLPGRHLSDIAKDVIRPVAGVNASKTAVHAQRSCAGRSGPENNMASVL